MSNTHNGENGCIRRVKRLAGRVLYVAKQAMISYHKPNVKSIFDHTALEIVCIASSSGELVHTSKLATPEQIRCPFKKKEAYVFRDVLVWVQQGVVGELNGTIFAETGGSNYQLRNLLNRVRFSTRKPILIETPCVSFDRDPFWTNYYHSLVDNLPRLYALHHEPFVNMQKILLLLPRQPKEFEQIVMKAILPPNVKTMMITEGTNCVHAKQYIYLPFLNEGYNAASLPPEYLKWFRKRLFDSMNVEPVNERTERIYISRAKAPKRKFANENELELRLNELGFKKYLLEDLTFADQVNLFRRARFVVARHGAGLTNLLFATNCQVLEIADPNPARNYYRTLAATLNLPYANVVIEGAGRDDYVNAPIESVAEKIIQMSEYNEQYAHTFFHVASKN